MMEKEGAGTSVFVRKERAQRVLHVASRTCAVFNAGHLLSSIPALLFPRFFYR